MPKSIVDDANEKIATSVHEFAHIITGSRADQPIAVSFWQQMRTLFIEYKQELRKDVLELKSAESFGKMTPQYIKLEEAFRKNYLGDYSQTSIDEFFAEGFTNYQLHSRPSKWASEIGKLVNKYFKK